ncbi:GHKL domain-containing protein, partial [Candidatus Desantisbacteria bacterium]|nr:GHKL domain-containing protein [Candidatus Desantisbacteria bacterium]
NKETLEEKKEFAIKMKWLIIARFIIYGLAGIIAYFQMTRGNTPSTAGFLYINLIIYSLNIIYFIFVRKGMYLYTIAYVSLIADLLAMTWAVHLNGGLAGVIFPLNYIAVILIASILISQRAGVILTTVAGILFSLLISLEYLNILPPVPLIGIGTVLYHRKGYVVAVLDSKVICFYGVAIRRGYLSDRIKRQTKEIYEKGEQLIHVERMAMAAKIAGESAHEIKNPLSVIKFGLYYLGRILPENEEAQKTISSMDKATERAVSYIDILLSFSRSPVLMLKMIDVHKVIEESINELSQELLVGIEIKKDFASDVPLLKADQDKLKQVFANLIKNAAEAMGEVESRELRVESRREGEFVKISISDTGRGIPEEDLKRIFDPFFTTKGKSTGLGLAICQRIIEAHKGEIEGISEMGKGMTFVVKLSV